MSPIERYAMKFVEQTGANWAQQIKAVEAEIEQQKREWEEKRLVQLQQEDQERIKTEKDENELLTYSREDALNKVNIKSSSKSIRKSAAAAANNNLTSNNSGQSNNNHGSCSSSSSIRIKSENASQSNHSPRSKNNNSNGTSSQPQAITRNGIMKSSPQKKSPGGSPVKRHLRNTSKSFQSGEEALKMGSRIIPRRALSRKSDRSSSSIISKKTNVRSISESTRSTSMSRQTSSVHDDSDSECSLDVMIDSNDVNDNSDSNSNVVVVKAESNFDSTSQDDDTAVNDDSTITDETTIEKTTSSPRTRSRGTVKIDLWTLDDSPILPPKRQKTLSQSQKSDNIQLKEFGMKECKVSVIDIHTKSFKASPQSRAQKRLMTSAKNNHTLDSWIQKVPEAVSKPKATTSNETTGEENDEKPTPRTTRRNANKTL